MNKLGLFTLFCICISMNASAKIYHCTDNHGNPIYKEQPIGKNCHLVDNIGGQFSTISVPAENSAAYNNDTDTSADDLAQKKRLNTAKRNLEDAKKALEEGKKIRYGNERNYVKYQERIQNLENAVNARQQELDNLK